MLIKDDT